MAHSLNNLLRIKALITILGLTCLASSAQIPETDYFRYFVIEVSDLNTNEESTLLNTLDSDFYELRQTCLEQNKILVALNASYPKRILDILNELQSAVDQSFPSSQKRKIEQTTPSDLPNFCQ